MRNIVSVMSLIEVATVAICGEYLVESNFPTFAGSKKENINTNTLQPEIKFRGKKKATTLMHLSMSCLTYHTPDKRGALDRH